MYFNRRAKKIHSEGGKQHEETCYLIFARPGFRPPLSAVTHHCEVNPTNGPVLFLHTAACVENRALLICAWHNNGEPFYSGLRHPHRGTCRCLSSSLAHFLAPDGNAKGKQTAGACSLLQVSFRIAWHHYGGAK